MPRKTTKSLSRRERPTERWLATLLAAYSRRGGGDIPTREAYHQASQQLDDLASHEPETFWRFLELALEAPTPFEALSGLGRGPLMWLLRYYPDHFDKRVAGAARRDQRMRQLVAEIDPDRIAPDVWRQLGAAMSGAR